MVRVHYFAAGMHFVTSFFIISSKYLRKALTKEKREKKMLMPFLLLFY